MRWFRTRQLLHEQRVFTQDLMGLTALIMLVAGVVWGILPSGTSTAEAYWEIMPVFVLGPVLYWSFGQLLWVPALIAVVFEHEQEPPPRLWMRGPRPKPANERLLAHVEEIPIPQRAA